MFRVPVALWCATRCPLRLTTAHHSRMLKTASCCAAVSGSLFSARRAVTYTCSPSLHAAAYTPNWRVTTRVGGVGVSDTAARRLHTTSAACAATQGGARKPTDKVEATSAAQTPTARAEAQFAAQAISAEPEGAAKTSAPTATDVPAPAAAGAAATSPAAAKNDATADNAAKEEEESGKDESWWRRWWRSFKSEGKDFSVFYVPFYPGTFLVLYAAFATEALHKETMLDYVLDVMGDYVDRKKMYARIEAWNTWANLGFAFIINELIEVVRFPVVVILYYATKPYSTRFAHWMLRVMRKIRPSKAAREAKK